MSDYAASEIRRLVWSGFYDAEEIREIVVEEIFEPGEIDEDWVVDQIDAEFAAKERAEREWPAVTDCDRLDKAFDELDEQGIIALQNAGYTQEEGIEEVSEEYDAMGGEASGASGYCFYHGQDLERAVDGQGLLMSFGDILGAPDKGVEVGRRIVEVLERHGFRVNWSGSLEERIEIPEMEWQRRFEE